MLLNKSLQRRLELALLIFLFIGVDQMTKSIARESLRFEQPRHLGVLTMLYTENSGAFLSIGTNLPNGVRTMVFDGIVAIALGAAAFVLFRGGIQSPKDEVAIALIITGGVGNLIDRLRFAGRVTDFLYVSAGALHTGVFNVADMAITCGILWLVLSWGFARRSTRARVS